MNVKTLARSIASKLGNSNAIILFASELLRHVDVTQVSIISQALRGLVASENQMDNIKTARELLSIARSLTASQIAQTIAEQMGGVRRLKTMLGAQVMAIDSKTLGIKWPNKQRSKGNYVEISLRGDDTYDMEFFNVSMNGRKSVKNYRGIYFDQLVPIFEKQTGWYLRL